MLAPISHAAITDPGNEVLVSAATIWEIAIKVGIGKLSLSQRYRPWIEKALFDLRATLLPVDVETTDVLSSLSQHHRDPFDRMLVAHCLVDGAPLVSGDPAFDAYGIQHIW